jgi:hypothetical protein
MSVKEHFKIGSYGMLWIVIGVLFIGGLSLGALKLFGPAEVAIKRQIFEESKSYKHGKIEHFQRLKLKYDLTENESHKNAIRQIILTESATVDTSEFPHGLQAWIRSIQ